MKGVAHVSKDSNFHLLSWHLHLSWRQNLQIILTSSTLKVVFKWAPPLLEISVHQNSLCLSKTELEIAAVVFADQNKIKKQLEHCKEN